MHKKILKSTIIVMIFIFISRVIGFFRELFIAYHYGVSNITDAFYTALIIPEFLNRMLITGGVGAVFIPAIIKHVNERNNMMVEVVFNNARTILSVFTFLISLLVCIFSKVIIEILGPEIPKETMVLTQQLLSILSFSILGFSLISLDNSLLNAYRLFSYASITPLVQNLFFIFVSWTFHGKYGIYSLAIAVIISLISCLVYQYIIFKKHLGHIKGSIRLRLTNEVCDMAKLFIPAMFGLFIVDIIMYLDRFISIKLDDGLITFLNYSNKLLYVPIGIIGGALFNVLYPEISSLIKNANISKLKEMYQVVMRSIILIFSIITLIITLYSENAIKMLFEYGKFTANNTHTLAHIFILYSLSIPAIMLIMLNVKVFHAAGKVKLPIIAGLISIAIKFMLGKPLIQVFGMDGMIYSTTISLYIGSVIMTLFIQKVFNFRLSGIFYSFIIKNLIVCFTLFAIFNFLVLVPSKLIFDLISSILIVLAYTFLLVLLKVDEGYYIMNNLKKYWLNFIGRHKRWMEQ